VQFVPVTVAGVVGATSIDAGFASGCAVVAGGAVRCWGWNSYGANGSGTSAVEPLASTVSGVTGATQVSTGVFHACALITGGQVACWGGPAAGQTGLPVHAYAPSRPQTVSPG
jgi:alpha-tubulin suppressor-like RCC1 family protein